MGRRAIPPVERFLARFDQGPPDECWIWQGTLTEDGYGLLRVYDKVKGVHVLAYEYFVGPIPEGYDVDHVCHNEAVVRGECAGGACSHRACVNPAHLEAVSRSANLQRSLLTNAGKTHCPEGHLYDERNTYVDPRGRRRCRTCESLRKGGSGVIGRGRWPKAG